MNPGGKIPVVDGIEGFRAASVYPDRMPRFLSAFCNQLRTYDVTALISEELGLFQPDIDMPNPELATTQKKLLDALSAADAAKKEAAATAGRLEGTTKALAEASAKRQAAETTVAGVVDAMKANKTAWSAANLDTYLADPRGDVHGAKMFFKGLPESKDRADVIAYLTTLK